MFFDILTLFPAMFDHVFADSILKRAIEKKLISVNVDNIRNYTHDAHNSVDDYPYGGDPGMLLKPEPLAEAIKESKKRMAHCNPKVLFMSPQGERLTHSVVEELHEEKGLIVICGRYKGVDQRIRDKYVDREISVGDFVLSGGEIPAMALIDSVSRFVPGVLGNSESAGRDSFYDGILSSPYYTRPEEFEGMRVPDVLLSGHHAKIAQWQRDQAVKITKERRVDLWEKYVKNNKNEKK